MLANEKWGLSENGKTLMDAANYMDEHGWCRGKAGMYDGSVCLYGAIAAVIGAVKLHEDGLRIDIGHPNFKSFLAIQNAIEESRIFINGAAKWNDKGAKSKEQVVAKLRELAYLF